jgi:4-amino-4-deoxy-L-arabinose transferase-like glycosyltransferase
MVIAAITLLLHLGVNATGGYDYFRDELYYIACARHLDWGYVDHPPLSILILRGVLVWFGDSIFAIRLLPAMASAALVLLTAQVARQLGGGTAAAALAALAVAVSPVFLIVGDFYSMNALEPLFWTGAGLCVVAIVRTGDARLWLLFGLITGLGLQNKHSMAFFAAALLSGLLATRPRVLATRWLWMGGALAFLIFLPNVLWQINHGWPTLEFARNAQEWKNAAMSPLEFFAVLTLFHHPAAAPLWIGGAIALTMHPSLRRYRAFAIAFALLFALFVVQRGKPYYLSPLVPMLAAAGAVAFEAVAARRDWRRATGVYAGALLVAGLLGLPLFLPVLPPERYVRYAAPIGLAEVRLERHDAAALPQWFADRFGWREMVAEVARVYATLSADDRQHTMIFAQNYGQAGAVDFFGEPLGLPAAISGHNNYWHWGTGRRSPEILIIIGGRPEDHRQVFESVEAAGTHVHPFAMPHESPLTIYVCRRPRHPVEAIWPRVRHYD